MILYKQLKTVFLMDAIRFTIFILIFIPIFSFGQKLIYPKDTIFVEYKEMKGAAWNAKFERKYQNKAGIYFNVEMRKVDMAFFYPYTVKSDTLCIELLKDYLFSEIEEIRLKEIEWVNRKYKNSKYKPYSGSKNAVFQTYLIEVISESKFVKYPVIWRNEGSID